MPRKTKGGESGAAGRIEISGFKRPLSKNEAGGDARKQDDYSIAISGSLPTELTIIITRSGR